MRGLLFELEHTGYSCLIGNHKLDGLYDKYLFTRGELEVPTTDYWQYVWETLITSKKKTVEKRWICAASVATVFNFQRKSMDVTIQVSILLLISLKYLEYTKGEHLF